MVVGTLSFLQKGHTRRCSGHSMQWISGIWWWGHCLSCKKVKPVDSVDAVTKWTQYTVDAVHAVHWTAVQWTHYAVDTVE